MKIVMGLPGAGKSTVLEAAEAKGYTIKNYGTLMFEIASKLKYVSHRDEIRKMSAERQREVQAKVGEELSKMHDPKIVLDTHCSIAGPKGYLPGLPFSFLSKLQVEGLILITASVDEILARRADPLRVRDKEGEDSLRQHDDMNRNYLAAYSMVTGAPAAIIYNKQGKLEEAQAQLIKLLE